jgi:hypothetical protein
MISEEVDTFAVGNSVEIVSLNPNTAKNIAAQPGRKLTEQEIIDRLGAREVGFRGIVTEVFLCFGSFAYQVSYVDELGSRNGTMGIIFPGEGKRIHDILVHS